MAARPGELIERSIAAHGGRDRWAQASAISARVSAGGLAFALKLQGAAVRDLDARVSTRSQQVTFAPYPQPGQRGVLEPDGSVRIESDEGEVRRRRERPREAFADARHKLWWDRLDMLYFATYAMWTYIAIPFVLEDPGYGVRELDAWREDGSRWRRLAVTFPAGIHTHCREQVFYFDDSGLIRRHDYTAEPMGGWAKAAHYCFEHRSFDGFTAPTRRFVYRRRRDNRAFGRPRLVWIEISDVRAVP